jgi:MSHA biogenesis protein MshO
MIARPPAYPAKRVAGFTLLEMIVTIAILGILSAIVTVFLQKPVQGYVDTTRRAQLVQTADFALRRIARDLAAAVPNSARAGAGGQILELLLVRSGGRYCNAADCGDPLPGNGLCATCRFSVIGPAVVAADVSAGDAIVVGNLPNSGCDAYTNTEPNRRTVQASNSSTVTFSETSGFSSSCTEFTKRYQIVSGPVSYACDSTTNTLWRYSGYAIQTNVQGSVAALSGLAGSLRGALATNVNCAGTNFTDIYRGDGLIQLQIELRDLRAPGESVRLYRQVKVDNTP